MSLQIIKAGVLDTIQDLGRKGYQHLGINPGGAMDSFSARLCLALLGKEPAAPLVEMHFPAATILFTKPTVICLTGADFTATVNDQNAPLNQPVMAPANSILQFQQRKQGARVYLALLQNFLINRWLGSYSTNLKAAAGGYKGRRLLKGDSLAFEDLPKSSYYKMERLPWRYPISYPANNHIGFITGTEWSSLTTAAQKAFLNNEYLISPASDRMGYRLSGEALEAQNISIISSAVSFGTVQLLPNGQLIVLMADHQTMGGYPKIAHVATAHLQKLAQLNAGDTIKFVFTTLPEAEALLLAQHQLLAGLQMTCRQNILNKINGYRY